MLARRKRFLRNMARFLFNLLLSEFSKKTIVSCYDEGGNKVTAGSTNILLWM